MSIGFYIYQEIVEEEKKKMFVKFGLITMNEQEAWFSQPTRELFGLKWALVASKYLLIGCRKWVVETDTSYIHGMLNNPEMGPNMTINQWIKKILMFHFELQHVTGKMFGPDSLSQRDKQEGDKEYLPDQDAGEISKPPVLTVAEGMPPPLKFEDFKGEINSRGGYLMDLADSIDDFEKKLEQAQHQLKVELEARRAYQSQGGCKVGQYTNQIVLPKDKEMLNEEYPEEHRIKAGKMQDQHLPLIKE